MPGRPSTYFAAHAELSDELARLRLIEEFADPVTERRLTAIGVASRWRCLEVGAGAGSIARWLAGQVGPEGGVVAMDMDPRFLADLHLPNVEVCARDVVEDDLERDSFDLAHTRAVLTHVSDPRKAARRMVDALRPGGWLLIEEVDMTVQGAADPTHPRARTYDDVIRRIVSLAKERGIFDAAFGRSVARLVDDLGLVDTSNEAGATIVRGGTKRSHLWKVTLSRMREILLASGACTESKWDEFEAAHDDPSFEFFEASVVAAWGRKPA